MSQQTKIAFTSCTRFKFYPEQPEWREIEESVKPDYLFLLGDQIYMDWGPCRAPKEYSANEFPQKMNEKYQEQWNERHFKHLLATMKQKDGQRVFGVWDDHDFAWDNATGGGSDPDVPKAQKESSRELFHKWMNCSTNLPEVYCYADLPHARAIFLDNRYYAQPPGKDNDLLGEEQFQFLEAALQHDRQYTFICAGMTLTQVGTVCGVNLKKGERWELYNRDYRRFCKLVKRRERVVFLSGDVHRNAFAPPDPAKRPCYEIIASGLAVRNLGFGWDRRHNWAVLEYDEKGISVSLRQISKTVHYYIDSATWMLDKCFA